MTASIFKDSTCQAAYLKMGVYGEAGSGKTFTSSRVAIGLTMLTGDTRPVLFIDSETGTDYVAKDYEEAGVRLRVAKTRAFADLLKGVDEAEKEASVLIIDSITHFWNELLDSYLKASGKTRLALSDWGPIKKSWREFTDKYINSRVHIIMCGRAGYIWEDEEDEQGVKELRKVGTKMKAEIETGYEPSLLVEMVKVRETAKKGARWLHRAYIVKDRFDVIDGKAFDNPDLKAFMPHVQLLNIGGEHVGVDSTRNSEDMFEKGETGYQKKQKKDALLEKIQNEIYLLYPSQGAEDKKSRLTLLKKIFGTHAWSEIEAAPLNNLSPLETGLRKIEALTNPAESDKQTEKEAF